MSASGVRRWWRRRAVCGRCARRAAGCEHGQGTVEYAVMTAAFLALVVALGVLWRPLEGGLFVEHALMAASHHVQGTAPGGVADVFLY